MKKLAHIIGVFLIGYVSIMPTSFAVRTFPRLPLSYRNARFQKCENTMQDYLTKFLNKEKYQLWFMNRPEKEIIEEYNQLCQWREKIWFKDPSADTLESQEGLMISQELLINNRYRYPHLIAFEYNNTDSSYNASNIFLNGLKFLALEAPAKTSLDSFYHLLHNYQATHLVRLTPAMEDGNERCYPYWEGHKELNDPHQDNYLQVPLKSEESNPKPYKIRYFWTDSWKNNHGGHPKKLLDLILQVRKSHNPSSLIAVHCHAGVSRTGTFIAGFVLLNEIDRQIKAGTPPHKVNVSIEKIVMELAPQRFYMIALPEQYLTLYRLVDLYVEYRSNNID